MKDYILLAEGYYKRNLGIPNFKALGDIPRDTLTVGVHS